MVVNDCSSLISVVYFMWTRANLTFMLLKLNKKATDCEKNGFDDLDNGKN